jgi:hypothetical protein
VEQANRDERDVTAVESQYIVSEVEKMGDRGTLSISEKCYLPLTVLGFSGPSAPSGHFASRTPQNRYVTSILTQIGQSDSHTNGLTDF